MSRRSHQAVATGCNRVQPGDTLSQIASRIDGRSIALWPAVDAIFAANPDAFLNNDRDLLLAGAWLIIPEMTGASPLVTNLSASEILPDTGLADDASRVAYNGVATPDIDSQPALIEEAVTVVEPAAATVAKPATPAMRPVDIAVKADDTYGPPAPEVVVDIPDTVIQAPQGAQPAPAIVNTDPDATWSWSWWFGGAGFTLIFALLLFRRQIRDRFRAVAVSVLSVMSRPHDDKPAPRSIVPNIDFRFDAETGNSGSMTLDADLDAGTGLQHTADGAVAREFGLSTSGETDNSVGLEKQEQAADEEEQQQTDVIPATPKKKDTILVNEVLATGGVTNVDYDISMMADLVERVVEDDDATVEHIQTISGNKGNSSQGTPGNDFEREIFEKDYEDAAIATGVFSKDMLEDVRGLAEGVGDDDFVGDTAEMPVSQETAITAELAPNFPESGNAEIDELDFSPDNAEPEGNLDTVEFDHLAFKKSKAG